MVSWSSQTVLTPASLFGGPTMSSPSTRVIARWIFTVPVGEVEVAPLQADRFTAAHPGDEHEPVEQPVGVVLGGAEEPVGLVPGPHLRRGTAPAWGAPR